MEHLPVGRIAVRGIGRVVGVKRRWLLGAFVQRCDILHVDVSMANRPNTDGITNMPQTFSVPAQKLSDEIYSYMLMRYKDEFIPTVFYCNEYWRKYKIDTLKFEHVTLENKSSFESHVKVFYEKEKPLCK
jgi:hypothetical protein